MFITLFLIGIKWTAWILFCLVKDKLKPVSNVTIVEGLS